MPARIAAPRGSPPRCRALRSAGPPRRPCFASRRCSAWRRRRPRSAAARPGCRSAGQDAFHGGHDVQELVIEPFDHGAEHVTGGHEVAQADEGAEAALVDHGTTGRGEVRQEHHAAGARRRGGGRGHQGRPVAGGGRGRARGAAHDRLPELPAEPLDHVARHVAAPDGVHAAGHVGLHRHAHPRQLRVEHRLGRGRQHALPGAGHVEDHAGSERADRQRPADVVVAAEDDRRALGQAGGGGRRGVHFAQGRAAGECVAQNVARQAGQADQLVGPIAAAAGRTTACRRPCCSRWPGGRTA